MRVTRITPVYKTVYNTSLYKPIEIRIVETKIQYASCTQQSTSTRIDVRV
jgi:hypothetical protein